MLLNFQTATQQFLTSVTANILFHGSWSFVIVSLARNVF